MHESIRLVRWTIVWELPQYSHSFTEIQTSSKRNKLEGKRKNTYESQKSPSPAKIYQWKSQLTGSFLSQQTITLLLEFYTPKQKYTNLVGHSSPLTLSIFTSLKRSSSSKPAQNNPCLYSPMLPNLLFSLEYALNKNMGITLWESCMKRNSLALKGSDG